MKYPFALLLMLLVALTIHAADELNPHTNIAYGSETRQILDVFLPAANETPVPVIFMVHGGGYIFGDKIFLRSAVNFFVEQGYAVVTPNYRLAPAHPYPAPLNDIFCAYAWMLSHADEYALDLNRITLMGESAGANAAAMLAAVDDPSVYLTECENGLPESVVTPKAAVLYYAPIDLSSCVCRTAKRLAALYLGFEGYDDTRESDMREQAVEASPLPWLDGHEPPFLLFHGTADTLIPVSESELFAQKVDESGGQAELVIVPDALHGFFARPFYAYTRDTWQQTLDFLNAVDAGPG